MTQVRRIIGLAGCFTMVALFTVGCGGSDSNSSSESKGSSTSSTTSTTTAPVDDNMVEVTGTLQTVAVGCLVLHGDDGVDWAIGPSPSEFGLSVPTRPAGGAVIVEPSGATAATEGAHVTLKGSDYPSPMPDCTPAPAKGMLVAEVTPA